MATKIDLFIYFIVAIKVCFLISALAHVFMTVSTKGKKQTKHQKELDHKFEYWKERTEFVFIFSMSILLIITFNPRATGQPITRETSLLFFLFGWILIITANWGQFVHEAGWFKRVQDSLK